MGKQGGGAHPSIMAASSLDAVHHAMKPEQGTEQGKNALPRLLDPQQKCFEAQEKDALQNASNASLNDCVRTQDPGSNMLLRSATMRDAKALLDWRNDESTLRACHQSKEVQWEGHCHWLEATLKNPKRTLLIYETADGERAGTVEQPRSDRCHGDCSVVTRG